MIRAPGLRHAAPGPMKTRPPVIAPAIFESLSQRYLFFYWLTFRHKDEFDTCTAFCSRELDHRQLAMSRNLVSSSVTKTGHGLRCLPCNQSEYKIKRSVAQDFKRRTLKYDWSVNLPQYHLPRHRAILWSMACPLPCAGTVMHIAL